MSNPRTHERNATFAVCVDTGNYPVSLERWKIYRVLPDDMAERHRQLRVVDESGQDYLYPKEFFTHIDLPATLAKLHHQHSSNPSG